MNRRVVFVSAFAAVMVMSLAAYAQRPGRQGGPGLFKMPNSLRVKLLRR
jgi:hypothetical protein